MGIEVGLAKGLAQSVNYDQRINDERYYQQQMDRAKAENIASLKAFENDNEYMNASNSYDNPLIDAEAKKTILEIGKLAKQNPNWQSDPDTRRLINEKRRYLKSNPNVIRGMASDEAFKNLNKDLAEVAKNPSQHDTAAYQELLNKKNNYIKFGHQDGEEGLARDGGPQAFVYDKPEDFVPLNEEALKTAGMIKARQYKDHGNGGYEELVDENSLVPAAMDFYNRHKRQMQVTYNPKSDEEGVAYAKELIRPGISLARKFGVPNRNHALEVEMWKAKQIQKGGRVDSYQYDIVNTKGNKLNTEAVRAMIGTTPKVNVHNQDAHNMGSVEGKEFIPNGNYVQEPFVYQGKDGKWHSDKSKTIGVIHGKTKYNEADMDATGWLDDNSMNSKITQSEELDKKGKKQTFYYVDSQTTFDPKETKGYQFRYNQFVGETNKQLEGMSTLSNDTNIPQYSVSDLRKDPRWTEQDIQRAINEGLAK